MYETINSPINYGGLELKNRIIFAPTTFGLSDDAYFEKIRKIAAGGCAMIIIGDVPVGKSQFEKSLFDKKGFAYYQKLAEIVHSYNCRICAQLHQSDSNMLAMLKYVPGVLTKKISMQELRPLLNAEVAPYITKLSVHKIHKIINGFGEAAVLAVRAGCRNFLLIINWQSDKRSLTMVTLVWSNRNWKFLCQCSLVPVSPVFM